MPDQPRAAAGVSEFAFADGVAGPRKQPIQERSRQTVAAILEATFRVLDEAGEPGLTTTRVAEVAGCSVGTLYQYFPNRDALLNALLAEHLEASIVAVERAAQASRGLPLDVAIDRVVRAFLAEKGARVENSRILDKAFTALDDRPLVRTAVKRAHVAVATLLAQFEPEDSAMARARLGCDALEGVVRGALTDPDRLGNPAWVDQVVRMIVAGLG